MTRMRRHLKKAVDLARTKAEALAEASGRTLGYVVSIEEYSDSQYGRYVDGGVNLKKGKRCNGGSRGGGHRGRYERDAGRDGSQREY